MTFKRGTFSEVQKDAVLRGWVVGHMQEPPLKTDGLEIKFWKYESLPEGAYGVKAFEGDEFILVCEGALTFRFHVEAQGKRTERIEIVEGTKRKNIVVSLKRGDEGEVVDTSLDIFRGGEPQWIFVPRGTKKEVWLSSDGPAWGITVRWPSVPGANQILR